MGETDLPHFFPLGINVTRAIKWLFMWLCGVVSRGTCCRGGSRGMELRKGKRVLLLIKGMMMMMMKRG